MNHLDYKFNQFYIRWSLFNNLIILTGFVSTLLTGSYTFWIGFSVLSFGIYIVKLPHFLPRFPMFIGYPNWISISRLIVILIAFSIHKSLSDIILLIIFGAVILLDSVDGAVARRINQTSKAGEYLDMEIDALFVFIISFIHFEEQKLPIWIIIPGSMRYVYGLLFFWMQEPPSSKPGKRVRSFIAAVFFISLLFPFVFNEEIYTPVVISSSILIMISFGISTVYRVIYHISFNRSSDLS